MAHWVKQLTLDQGTVPGVGEPGQPDEKAKILCDLKFQTDKQLLANQPELVVVAKGQKWAQNSVVRKPKNRLNRALALRKHSNSP